MFLKNKQLFNKPDNYTQSVIIILSINFLLLTEINGKTMNK